MYVIYTELHPGDGTYSRWYYGVYPNQERANDIALQLSNSSKGIYRCVCKASDVKELDIQNIPDWFDYDN